MAARIAANRTVAGVHYTVDSAVGAMLGVALGQYISARARGAGAVTGRSFLGDAYKDGNSARDFHFQEFHNLLAGDAASGTLPALTPRPAPLLGWIWEKAEEEHARQWI
jgi:hypothetical protein